MDTALDNPFWSALDSIHREVALRSGDVARYPAAFAPFLGVASVDTAPGDAFDLLVAPGESVYLLGIAPVSPVGWRLQAFRPLAQMVCDAPLPMADGPDIVPLGDAQREDVLALTALVYPHYFRARTMDLGRYFDIYEQGRLAAMIGERLGSAGSREMSAICTHPDFTGLGYARHLTAWLTNATLARGVQPFLHVSHENARAKALYEQLGYRVRRDIEFWSLTREGQQHTRGNGAAS
ncbi:GNAT family N-acetyltransferase [Pseudoxanthomonas japonensis]|uniref:GNAT family N-acetyltransferase n=1 Tax=Pseudoxanthomonas japonensis TaxID=69284 RepID=UPI0037487CB0